jgi:hypothetical protein
MGRCKTLRGEADLTVYISGRTEFPVIAVHPSGRLRDFVTYADDGRYQHWLYCADKSRAIGSLSAGKAFIKELEAAGARVRRVTAPHFGYPLMNVPSVRGGRSPVWTLEDLEAIRGDAPDIAKMKAKLVLAPAPEAKSS